MMTKFYEIRQNDRTTHIFGQDEGGDAIAVYKWLVGNKAKEKPQIYRHMTDELGKIIKTNRYCAKRGFWI